MFHNPDKPHLLPCPYKPVAQKRDVEELTGEAKDRALAELFSADDAGVIERSLWLAQYGPQWQH